MKLIKSAFFLGQIFFVSLLVTQQVYAERLTNLYTLSSLVEDDSDKQRALAANDLLKKLLVRISGTEKVLEKMPPADFIEEPEAFNEHPNFKIWTELSSAQRLINQYSYTSSSKLITSSRGGQVTAQQLELTFDEAGVKQLLRRLQAPVWDADRPKVLFWVALEGKSGRNIITPISNEPLSNVLISQSQERGIPHQLPDFSKYPATDTLLSDIWGGFSQQIIAASDPYQPDAIAVAKIKASGNNWNVELRLFTSMGSVWHTTSAATLREAFQAGVNFAAEQLSSRYASQVGQGAGTYRIMVADVNRVQDYAAINNYLNGLSLTKKVRLVESADQSILFEITLQGGLDQLRANLTLDGRLKEESFLGLQQASKYDTQPANAKENKESTEQVDAYFRWRAN